MQAWGEVCLSNQLPGNAGLGTTLALQRFRPNSLWLQASPSSPVSQAAQSLPVNLPHLPELPGLFPHFVNSALRTRYRQLKQMMSVITASICVYLPSAWWWPSTIYSTLFKPHKGLVRCWSHFTNGHLGFQNFELPD